MTARLRRDPRLALVPTALRDRGELRIADAWHVWRRHAEAACFDPLDVANLRDVAWAVFGHEVDTLALDELPAVFDALEGQARALRPAYAVAQLADGRLAIVADPDGNLVESWPAVEAAFREAARRQRDEHRRRRIAELRRGDDRPALRAIAERLGISLATAKRLTEGGEMSRNGSREGGQ